MPRSSALMVMLSIQLGWRAVPIQKEATVKRQHFLQVSSRSEIAKAGADFVHSIRADRRLRCRPALRSLRTNHQDKDYRKRARIRAPGARTVWKAAS